MTSSRTGQSPNVDATHSLWRMSVPPRRITDARRYMTLHIWAQMCSLFKTRRVMCGGRSRGFHAPMMFAVRFSNITVIGYARPKGDRTSAAR
jgi:hypothetical protein